MNNKLFIVCPFCNMELFLQKKYGKDIFFMTLSGGVIQTDDVAFLEAIRDFIERKNISTIYFVNETSCSYISNVINNVKLAGLQAEKIIEHIFIDNYSSDFKGLSLSHQQVKLAELNVKHQAYQAMTFDVFGAQIDKNDIKIKSIVTTKSENKLKEINLNKNPARGISIVKQLFFGGNSVLKHRYHQNHQHSVEL